MRVSSTSYKKHKKILELAKGYRMARSKRYRTAHETVLHAGQDAYFGRRLRKRDKRSEWIVQINAGLATYSKDVEAKVSYSKFINGLKKKDIQLDRKILAQMTMDDFASFSKVVETAMS